MALMKRTTQPIFPPPPPGWRHPCKPHRDWETHPSLGAGMELLNSYNEWVSEVLMPIAFMWIEEHYDEVYASVSEENKDDVGVVIAAAFELVKGMPRYAEWVQTSEGYEQEAADPNFDPAGMNPVWRKITKKIREAAHHTFEQEASVLKSTIRTAKP